MLRMEKQLRGNPTALLPIQSILAMPGAVSASLEGASHCLTPYPGHPRGCCDWKNITGEGSP